MDKETLPDATEAELSPPNEPVEEPIEDESEGLEDEPEPSPDEEAQPEPKLSPSQQRIQREIEKRRQLEWDLAQARQNEARLQAQIHNRPIDPYERQRRLEAMEPDERYQYLLNERDQATRGELNQLRYQMLSSNDSFQFQSYLARHPEFRKYEQGVESYFQQAVANGQPQSRNALLSWLIGERVRTRADGAVVKAKRQGNENLKKVATRPAAARSNVSVSERASMTAEQRLIMNLERGAYKGQI